MERGLAQRALAGQVAQPQRVQVGPHGLARAQGARLARAYERKVLERQEGLARELAQEHEPQGPVPVRARGPDLARDNRSHCRYGQEERVH